MTVGMGCISQYGTVVGLVIFLSGKPKLPFLLNPKTIGKVLLLAAKIENLALAHILNEDC